MDWKIHELLPICIFQIFLKLNTVIWSILKNDIQIISFDEDEMDRSFQEPHLRKRFIACSCVEVFCFTGTGDRVFSEVWRNQDYPTQN